MNRKSVLKLSLLGLLILLIVAIIVFVLYSTSSGAFLEKKNYEVGENVKIDLKGVENFEIKIKTPSTAFVKKGSDEVVVFRPEEAGSYEIAVSYAEVRETHLFSVGENTGKTEEAEKEHDVVNEVPEPTDSEEKFSQGGEDSRAISIGNVQENEYGKEVDVNEDFVFEFENAEDLDFGEVNVDYVSEEGGFFRIFSFRRGIPVVSIRNTEGKTYVQLEKSRAMKPGIYKIRFRTEAGNFEKEFAYGLISVNTKKSIYRPGDNAEFEIVVLDSQGAGVCEPHIGFSVLSKNGTAENFDGKIFRKECGLFGAEKIFNEEGIYEMKAETIVDGYKINFNSEFLVADDYDYEVVRTADSKIDPTIENNFKVRIDVESLKGAESLEVKEFVPSVFEVRTDAKVETRGDTKILTWNVNSGKASFDYEYSVPLEWPYLYELGKIKVNDFEEFRNWFVAVDPIIPVTNNSGQDVKIIGVGNTTFVVGWIPPGLNLVNVQAFDTNGTNLTGRNDVSILNTTAYSRIALGPVSTTEFLVGWTNNGSAGTDDFRVASYNWSNMGQNWFDQTDNNIGGGATPFHDVGTVASTGANWVACTIEDGEGDADMYSASFATPTTATETNVDTGANPDSPLTNQVECAVLNSTRVAFVWFDDSGDTISYSIRDQAGAQIIAQTTVTGGGTTGQVATTTLNQNAFAIAYSNITNVVGISIRDRNNNLVLGPTIIDTNGGTTPRVSIATVRNRTANEDWFVVAWNDRNSNAIEAKAFNSTGSNKFNYTLATDENETNLLFDIYGKDSLTGVGLCDEKFALAYQGPGRNVTVRTFRLNGTLWDGRYCDFANPLVDIVFPLSGLRTESNVQFQIIVNDSSPVTAFVTLNNGTTNLSMSSTDGVSFNATNTSIADGYYWATYYVTDWEGYRNFTQTVNFTINTTIPDTFPPAVSINFPANGAAYSAVFDLPLDFDVTLNENGSVRFTLDNGVNNYTMTGNQHPFGTAFNYTWEFLDIGTYTFRAYANDTAGNNNWSESSTFSIVQDYYRINGTVLNSTGEPQNVTLVALNASGDEVYNSTGFYNEFVAPLNFTYTLDIYPHGISYLNFIEFPNINFSLVDGATTRLVSLEQASGAAASILAIQPEFYNFTYGIVNFSAISTDIYKCASWNFSGNYCPGNWSRFRNGLTFGQNANFTFTTNDPGYMFFNSSLADHLDENYSYISSVYTQVQLLDGLWSETIPSGHYVRVAFSGNLTNDSVINFYPQTISGNPYIELYEVENNSLIGVATGILDNQYNSINFDNLLGNQSVFDMRILNGSLQFNHIQDPFLGVISAAGTDVSVTALDEETYVLGYVDGSAHDVKFIVYDAAGTPLTSAINVSNAATPLGGSARVTVTAINTTHFLIGWYNDNETVQDVTYSIYNRSGSQTYGPQDVDGGVGTVSDVDIIDMGDRFQYCYVDQVEGDADVRTVLYNTLGAGTETNIDGGVAPEANLQNLISCTAVNSTRFVYFSFDDGTADDATYYIRDENRVSIALADIDTAVGDTGQVAVTSMNRSRFVMFWFDSVQNQTEYSVRDINNNNIVAPNVVDANSGTESRIKAATVYNSSAGVDWFVLAWNDRDSDAIEARLYDYDGNPQSSYTLATDEDNVTLLFDIYGKDAFNGIGFCNDTFILAYTNISQQIVTKIFNIDGTTFSGYCDADNPLVEIISPLNQTYTVSSINFTINVTDESPITAIYTLNEGLTNNTMTSGDGEIYTATNNSIADGSYTARFYISDFNNHTNFTESVTFSVDTTPPGITINLPSPAGVNYSLSNVEFNVTLDGIGNTCYYTLNGGVNNNSMSSTDLLNWNATNGTIADGLYTTNFYCNDSVGNLGNNSRQFRIDTTPPNVTIAHPQATNYLTDSLNLNFTARDSGVGVQSCDYSLDGGINNVSISSCQNTTFMAEQGNNTLSLYVNDSLGNLNNSQNVTFFVDSIIPLIQFRPPTALDQASRDENFIIVNLSITETNFANLTYELYNISSGGNHLVNRTTLSIIPDLFNWSNLNNSNMNYTYNVTVRDILGNANWTETRTITLTTGDTAPPDIFFVNPTPNGYYYNSTSIYFQVTLSEAGSAVWYQINTSLTNYSMVSMNLATNLSWNATNSSIGDGHYTLTVYANDSIGNLGNRERNFSVDTVFPLIDYGIGTGNNGINVSRNWTYVNISVVEINEANVTFFLYDSNDAEVNFTTFTDGTRDINWTDLSDGNYKYNVTITDLANNLNRTTTRNIKIDTTNPGATLISPVNNSFLMNRTQNFTINASDNLGLGNLTLRIYNETNVLINLTTMNYFGTDVLSGIQVTLPNDGNFSWSYEVRDSANNLNLTENWTLRVDTSNPDVNYTAPTEANGTEFERDWIFVNVSVSDLNFANITFRLFNNSGATIVNETTFNDTTREINWTGLSDLNVTYFYNVSVRDLANNVNSTETRTIRLVDITPPSLNLLSPLNKTYYSNYSLLLNFTAEDINLASCWYSLNGGANISLPGCTETEFNTTEGSTVLFLYANDSLGLISSQNVTFVANASLFNPRGGILAYGYGTLQTPYYRFWNGTGFTGNRTANSVGGTIEWVRAKSSPTRDEHIIVTANNSDAVVVQINGTNPLTGVGCWHNGTACGNVSILRAVSTGINRQKMDVAYETTGDDAIVVWSQNNATPAYRVWNGTAWGATLDVPQTLIVGGVVSYVKMDSHPFKEEISLIMTNTTAMNIIVWNGSSWGCEPSSLPNSLLTPDVFQHADLAYEQVSGDLFVASSIDALTEVRYTQKLNNDCNYTTLDTTTLAEEGERITVGAQYGTNRIIIEQYDIGGNDMHAIVWDGDLMRAVSGNDGTGYASASPSQTIGSGWAGTTQFGIAVYSDAAVSTNIDYHLYNASTNTWDGGTTGLDVSGLTAFSDEEQNIIVASYVEENKTLVIVQDDADDLWVKAYNGETNTWSQPDNGVALTDNVASTVFPAFDFNFDYDRYGPQIIVNSPRDYVNSTSVRLNITLLESATACTYKIDNNATTQMTASGNGFIATGSAANGQHNVTFTCEDQWENSRAITNSFIVDTIFPTVNFTAPTESNGTVIERNWIYVNVTVNETNEANVTFVLRNLTATVNVTILGAGNRTFNWTNLPGTYYYYNVTVTDLANNRNSSETRQINLTRVPPVVNLFFPTNGQNFSTTTIPQFNFSVSDDNSIINCSLYGNWTATVWHLNQTITSPTRDTEINFSSKVVPADRNYRWNVYCYDSFGTLGYNSTNFTFSSYLPVDAPILFNITQTNNIGTGNVTLFWNASNHSTHYRIYNSTSLSGNFSLLNTTTNLNYTDTSFSGSVRRFYLISAANPSSENTTGEYFGAHVYTLRHNVNTRNWIAFPTNTTYLTDANRTLNNIVNATAFTMWNETIQRRVTCNAFSCPSTISCTPTNCNFNFSTQIGRGYEVNINTSAPSAVNWSLVGFVNRQQNISLVKNATSFGKNWIALWGNTSLSVAHQLLQNISNSDAVSRWDSAAQTSRGLIPSPFPFGPPYIGTNFSLVIEEGYEVSVTAQANWTQR